LWLHHFCLGHPSFRVLKLFPLLFKGLDMEDFHCDVCEVAKDKRVSFSPANKRSSLLFTLVHSDIWGPFIVPNFSRARWFVSFVDDCTHVVWLYLLKGITKPHKYNH